MFMFIALKVQFGFFPGFLPKPPPHMEIIFTTSLFFFFFEESLSDGHVMTHSCTQRPSQRSMLFFIPEPEAKYVVILASLLVLVLTVTLSFLVRTRVYFCLCAKASGICCMTMKSVAVFLPNCPNNKSTDCSV